MSDLLCQAGGETRHLWGPCPHCWGAASLSEDWVGGGAPEIPSLPGPCCHLELSLSTTPTRSTETLKAKGPVEKNYMGQTEGDLCEAG